MLLNSIGISVLKWLFTYTVKKMFIPKFADKQTHTHTQFQAYSQKIYFFLFIHLGKVPYTRNLVFANILCQHNVNI